jgi:hypothetical protein
MENMTPQEIIGNLKNTPESIRDVYGLLLESGDDDQGAKFSIFLALGGDDCVWERDDGTSYYARSGVDVGSINRPPEWDVEG